MTPFYDVNGVVSTLTVGAFEDIGYTVDYSKADVYTSPSGAGLFPPGAISGVGGVLMPRTKSRLVCLGRYRYNPYFIG